MKTRKKILLVTKLNTNKTTQKATKRAQETILASSLPASGFNFSAKNPVFGLKKCQKVLSQQTNSDIFSTWQNFEQIANVLEVNSLWI